MEAYGGCGVFGRLLIGAASVFLIAFAITWWIQTREGVTVANDNDPTAKRTITGTAATLLRCGVVGFLGSLGLLVAWISVLGPDRTEWAQRGALAMFGLALAPVSAWGSVAAWRASRADTIPASEQPGYIETAISEGRTKALTSLLWELLPPRFALRLMASLFAVTAVGLLVAAVGLVSGASSLEPPGSSGPVESAKDIYGLLATLVFLGLFLGLGVGALMAGLLRRDLRLAGVGSALLTIYAAILAAAYLLGWPDDVANAVGKLVDLMRG
jgi:hypothetical protein